MHGNRGRVAAGAVSLLLCVAGCTEFHPGPDLRVEVVQDSLDLNATTGDPSLCCCAVTGTVINESSVPVHVTLQFDVYRSGETDPVGRAVDFQRDIQPNEGRAIRAAGLLFACSEADRIEVADVDIRGVWFP